MTPSGRIETRDWMTAPATRAVLDALTAGGATVRFVGGCVRDAVAGRLVKDIDLATPDSPDTVIALLEKAGLKAVPTGIEHGTVTAVAHGRPFEVTTLRRDVETFGRHARVAFTDDWVEDAARRDLTFNAMFCDADGTLYDPFDGREDLAAGRVRFVGEARRRIEEDVLRLLRFFRFFAWYGQPPADAEAIAACRELAPRLDNLSGERVQAELLRLLGAPDPMPALDLMAEHDVLTHMVPDARSDWRDRLAGLVALETALDEPSPVRRLAATVGGGAETLAERLRLSRADRDRLIDLVAPSRPFDLAMDDRAARRTLRRLGRERFHDFAVLARVDAGHDAASDFKRLLSLAGDWHGVTLPVQGRDLLDRGIRVGRRRLPPQPRPGAGFPGRSAGRRHTRGVITAISLRAASTSGWLRCCRRWQGRTWCRGRAAG
jgi:poly(A) polymerase